MDAVVGGGGLVQLPALLLGLPGASPVQLLATNKLASACGTTVSSVTYYRRVRPDPGTFLPLMGFAFAGSMAGAAAASLIPASAFDPIILVVLVVVGAYVLFKPDLGRETALRFSGHRHTAAAMLTGLVIGFYDGALGPGTGSFFVFTLVGLLGYNFLDASAKARMANWATNIAALVVFIPQGAVLWGIGLTMGVGEPGRRLPRRPGRGGPGGAVRAGLLRGGGLGVHRPDRRRGAGPVGVTSYLTVARSGTAEIEVKRSRFLCTVERVADEAAARAVVERLRKQHWDARHHCSAFVLGPSGDVQRSSDDGEPAGTAGAPMLEVLRGREVSDVVVVVTRWFGGVLLGAGGLVRAYGDAVRAGLDEVGTRRRVLVVEHELTVSHADAGRLESELRSRGIEVLDAAYAEQVTLRLGVRADSRRRQGVGGVGSRWPGRRSSPSSPAAPPLLPEVATSWLDLP